MEKRVREIELFVPGRLCLFGEHSDWAGRYTNIKSEVVPGRAIVTGIDLGIYAKVSKSDRFEVVSFDEQGNPLTFSCDMNYEELKKNAESGGFFCYMCEPGLELNWTEVWRFNNTLWENVQNIIFIAQNFYRIFKCLHRCLR